LTPAEQIIALIQSNWEAQMDVLAVRAYKTVLESLLEKYPSEFLAEALGQLVYSEMFRPKPALFVKTCERVAEQKREERERRKAEEERRARDSQQPMSEEDKAAVKKGFDDLAEKLGMGKPEKVRITERREQLQKQADQLRKKGAAK
jgi:hypothetical protein